MVEITPEGAADKVGITANSGAGEGSVNTK